MRLPSILALLALAVASRADRLVTVPTARKLLDGTIRLETLRQFGAGGNARDYLAVGFAQAWELEGRVVERTGRDARLTGDLTYNVVAPLTGFSPGFALGVQDLGDVTGPGARAFACATFRNEFNHGNVPFDVTTGLTAGRRVRPYVGTAVPVYRWLRLLAEHDGFEGRAALEALPLRGLRVRVVGERGAVLGSIGYTARFR